MTPFGQRAAGVPHPQPDQVADAVGEEEPDRAGLEQGFGLPAQQPVSDQALGDLECGEAVDISPFDARPAVIYRGLLGRVNDRVQFLLERGQLPPTGYVRVMSLAYPRYSPPASISTSSPAPNRRSVGAKCSTAELGPPPTIVS